MISIIIPIYNAEKYINRCLLSIIKSSYKDFEVLCIDDGSTDKTNKILNIYAKRDNRIRIIHKQNGGSASARNVGLKEANGNYISFVDADDFIHVDYLKNLYDTAIKYNADMVECDFFKVSNNYSYENENFGTGKVSIIDNIKKMDEFCEKKTYLKSSVLWNKLYKKELFNDITFIENKGIDDEFVIHKIIYNAKKVAIIDMKLYYYYLSDDSQMRSKPRLNKIDNIEAIENQMMFLEEKGYYELKEKLYYRYYRALIGNINYLKKYFPNEKNKIHELKYKRRGVYRTILSKNVCFKDKTFLLMNLFTPRISKKIHDHFIGENLISINKEGDK